MDGFETMAVVLSGAVQSTVLRRAVGLFITIPVISQGGSGIMEEAFSINLRA